jgi:ABC-type uncharacterized transport system substrate-binding protein
MDLNEIQKLEGSGLKVHTFLLFLLIFVFSLPLPSHGGDIAVFTGENPLKVHKEVLRGFRSVCKAPARDFEVSEKDVPELRKKIAALAPKLILAVGSDALSASLKMENTPVVFTLVLREDDSPQFRKPGTGVDLLVSPELQMETIHEALPGVKRIGVIYNPAETGSFFMEAEKAASALGLSLVGRRAKTAADAISGIKSLEGRIDALWLIPDLSVLDYETVKYAMFFSFQRRVPVIAPSDDFVKNGALLGIGVDAFDIGVQAGQIANDIFSGRSAMDIPVVFARKVLLSVNISTARKLGITIPGDILKKSTIYGRER